LEDPLSYLNGCGEIHLTFTGLSIGILGLRQKTIYSFVEEISSQLSMNGHIIAAFE
jgi:hypothetical protein